MIGPTGPAGAGPNPRITPAGVTCPILAVPNTVNQNLQSGPVDIEVGPLFAERGNSASVVVVADAAQGRPAIAMISSPHRHVLTTPAIDRIPLPTARATRAARPTRPRPTARRTRRSS